MNIEFENAALEELYTKGTTQDHRYKRLQPQIIKQYVKVVNYIKAVGRLEDLYRIKSLHYEKTKGDLNGVDAEYGLTTNIACSSIVRLMKQVL